MARPTTQLPRASKFFASTVAAVGALALGHSIYALYTHPVSPQWLWLAAATLLSGSFTVKLPGIPAIISVSEVFVFTSILLFGTPAGTVTVALDGTVISLWRHRRLSDRSNLYRLFFNASAPALSIWLSSTLFFALVGAPAPIQPTDVTRILVPLALFAGAYFALNTLLVATAAALETKMPVFDLWRKNFLWISLNYFGGASVAALLVVYMREVSVNVVALGFILPLWIISYLTLRTSSARVEDANRHVAELNRLYLSTIEALAMAIDAKDQITHGHIRRVQLLAVGLAKALGVKNEHELKAIEAAALLHDMGKLAVPEYILNKPGKLTAAEFEKMKLHSSVGAEILSSIDFPYPVVPIVRHHHENWDGTGYPDGLKGSGIPVGARVLSVVDCFDALTSDRPYRPRLSDDEAIRILKQRSGSMYDPAVVEIFTRVYAEVGPSIPDSTVSHTALAAIARASKEIEREEKSAGFEQIRASTSESLVLYDLARSLGSAATLKDRAEIAASHLRRLLPATVCAFYMIDPGRDELVAAAVIEERADIGTGHRIPLGQRVSGWVAVNHQTIVNSDSLLDIGDGARHVSPRLRSCLSAALSNDKQVVGVLTLHSTGVNAFSEDHARVLEAVAHQTARILAEAYDTERRSPGEQPLLPDLEELQFLFAGAGQKHVMPGAAASVLLLRLEGLSRSAGSRGKALQGEVVATVVRAIRAALRGPDLLFRKNHDELVVALPQADSITLNAIASRIHASVREALHEAQSPGGAPGRVQVRVSVASSPDDGMVVAELIEAARSRMDAALFLERPTSGGPPSAVH